MANPEVYAGLGAGKNEIKNFSNSEILTGPNWFYTLTGNGSLKSGRNLKRFGNANTTWYCLDLLGKYHKKSALKQFHALTFYFRNSADKEKGAIITATLPESFSYSIGGVYVNPISLGGSDLVKAVISEITDGRRTLSFNVDTSLVWQSPKRMEITFKIPIFDDSGSGTNINYQEAIDLFGEAILPEVAPSGLYSSVPGPSIITALSAKATTAQATTAAQTIKSVRTAVNNLINSKKQENEKDVNVGAHFDNSDHSRWWDRISVQIGGLLLLDWCVIKDMKVTFPNTKAQVLHDYRNRNQKTRVADNTSLHQGYDYKVHLQPIQAEIEITIATVMGMTRAVFKDMLYQNESEYKYNASVEENDFPTGAMCKIDDSTIIDPTQIKGTRSGTELLGVGYMGPGGVF